jgi:hypothetical protein
MVFALIMQFSCQRIARAREVFAISTQALGGAWFTAGIRANQECLSRSFLSSC